MTDAQQSIGSIVQFGTVAAINAATGTCTVTIGDMTSPPLPWLSPRAGGTKRWSPPSKGEQVVVICPEGDAEGGFILTGLYSTANPPPSSDENIDLTEYSDGAVIVYDAANHMLSAVLPESGTASVVALGGIKFTGPVVIDGNLKITRTITADEDVIASGVSLKSHKHSAVKTGSDVSGGPQ